MSLQPACVFAMTASSAICELMRHFCNASYRQFDRAISSDAIGGNGSLNSRAATSAPLVGFLTRFLDIHKKPAAGKTGCRFALARCRAGHSGRTYFAGPVSAGHPPGAPCGGGGGVILGL